MIAVTGATGKLGQLVIKHLLKKTSPNQIVALVRNVEKAQSLQALGVQVREADYTKPATLMHALVGIDKLLLISSSELEQRIQQHQNVINAAQQSSVSLIAYTSLLHATSSPLGLAKDHVATEIALKQSGITHVLLRNGWYSENYLVSVGPALANSGLIGCAKEGKISSAPRDDYAEAAAVVLTSNELQGGKVYELAGDESYTLAELASVISEFSGKTIPYIDMPEAEFANALQNVGLPAPIAQLLANSDSGAATGALFDNSHTLSKLIGHPTQSLREQVKAYL